MSLMESIYNKLKKGAKAPDFSLPGTDGKTYSLADFKGAKALLIVFMCNHCPYVKPKLEELKRITADYKDKGLLVVGINSNDEKSLFFNPILALVISSLLRSILFKN